MLTAIAEYNVLDDMQTSLAILVLGVIAAYSSALVLATATQRLLRRRRRDEAHMPLDDKSQRVQDLSTELSLLNTEVQSEFALQIAATEQAKRDAENAAALALLNEEQKEPAARLVRAQIGEALDKNTKTERWFQVALSFGSFVAGVIATLILT